PRQSVLELCLLAPSDEVLLALGVSSAARPGAVCHSSRRLGPSLQLPRASGPSCGGPPPTRIVHSDTQVAEGHREAHYPGPSCLQPGGPSRDERSIWLGAGSTQWPKKGPWLPPGPMPARAHLRRDRSRGWYGCPCGQPESGSAG